MTHPDDTPNTSYAKYTANVLTPPLALDPPLRVQRRTIPGLLYHDVSVGMKELSVEGSSILLYDTGGPAASTTNIEQPLPPLRAGWITRRVTHDGPSEEQRSPPHLTPREEGEPPDCALSSPHYTIMTQRACALAGMITPEMEYVAIRENMGKPYATQELSTPDLRGYGGAVGSGAARITPELVREEIAAGRAAILGSICHPEAEPMIVGERFLVKVAANTGFLECPTDMAQVLRYMRRAAHYGADSLTELHATPLSTTIRNRLLRCCPIPIGTIPLYEALSRCQGDVHRLNWEGFEAVLKDQAEQGVDYWLIHPGIRLSYLYLVQQRHVGLSSYSGSVMARWCMVHQQENFLYTHFDAICRIAQQYDITLFLCTGLRAGCIADANDIAERAESETLAELLHEAHEKRCQTILESGGYLPLHLLPSLMATRRTVYQHAPLAVCGPMVTDIAPGYTHMSAAIGASFAAHHGASMLSCLTPQRVALTTHPRWLHETVVAHKLAAHTADLAKAHPGALSREHQLSMARVAGTMSHYAPLALDPECALALSADPTVTATYVDTARYALSTTEAVKDNTQLQRQRVAYVTCEPPFI